MSDATPLSILQFLRGENVTRKQVKSHLQRYRRSCRQSSHQDTTNDKECTTTVDGSTGRPNSFRDQRAREEYSTYRALPLGSYVYSPHYVRETPGVEQPGDSNLLIYSANLPQRVSTIRFVLNSEYKAVRK